MKHIEDVYFSNLNMICNMGGYFSISPKVDWSCKDDVFEQCKFYFITEGSCVIIIRGKSYVARAGDWFLIPSYEKHTFWNEKTENFSKYWMHFDVYPDNRFFESLGLPFVIHLDDIEKIEKLFKKFTTLNKSNDLSDKLTVKAIGFELLSNYVKLSSDSGVDVVSVSSETVDGILRYVNKNLSADLTDKALAEKFFMHKNHLVKIFSSKVGSLEGGAGGGATSSAPQWGQVTSCPFKKPPQTLHFISAPLFVLKPYCHHISAGFSKMMASFKNATAFSSPSLGDIRGSSCSMEMTPS